MPRYTRATRARFERIHDTLDDIQKNTDIEIDKTLIWRNALYSAYCEPNLPRGLRVWWADRDTDHQEIVSPLPVEIFETICQLWKDDKKLITLTIFHSTGKMRIQGRACEAWVNDEYDLLKGMVARASPAEQTPRRVSSSRNAPRTRLAAARRSNSEETLVKQVVTEDANCDATDNIEQTHSPPDNKKKQLRSLETRIQALETRVNCHEECPSVSMFNKLKEDFENMTIRIKTLESEKEALELEVAKLQSQIPLNTSPADHITVCPSPSKTPAHRPPVIQTQSSPKTSSATTGQRTSSKKPMNNPFIKNPSDGTRPKSSSSPTTTYSDIVSVSNYYQVLSEDSDHDREDNVSVKSNGHDESKNDKHSSVPPRPTATEVLDKQFIRQDTQCLFIGDSIIREIDVHKMYFQSKAQKICVPGITVADVIAWVKKQKRFPNVLAVTVHVGINSVKGGAINFQTWNTLLLLLKEKCPNAAICMSSIMPAFGQHSANDVIIPSNKNMRNACERSSAFFVDNDPIFRTDEGRGAPRRALYRPKDRFHPSRQGAIRLACNIKYNFDYYRPPPPPNFRPPPPVPPYGPPPEFYGDSRPSLLPRPPAAGPPLYHNDYNYPPRRPEPTWAPPPPPALNNSRPPIESYLCSLV